MQTRPTTQETLSLAYFRSPAGRSEMGSSEIASSLREVPSSFSLTCNRLSRYLKQQGSTLGNIELALTTPHRTMNLLSTMGSNPCNDEIREESGKSVVANHAAEMTIFYGGRVLVFGELPADKAQEIVKFAHGLGTRISRASPERAHHPHPPPPDSDLPIARKKSLAQFLEKRKDRDAAHAPYPRWSKPRM